MQDAGRQPDLPGPGPVVPQERRHLSLPTGRARRRRRPHQPAYGVRASRFSTGRCFGDRGDRGAGGREPGRRGRVALGPAVGGRRAPRAGVLCSGSSASGSVGPRRWRGTRSRPAADGPAAQTGSAVRSTVGTGAASAASTMAASGSTRPGAMSRRGPRVAAPPTARVRPRAAGACAAGACRRCGARDPGAAAAAAPPGSRRTPARPSRACPARRARPAARRAARRAPRRRARRSAATAGQRPGGPVGRRVALLQREAQHLLDDGAQPDARVAEQPAGQLGVEQQGRDQPDLGQARQVLRGGVQHPLGVGDRVAPSAERSGRATGSIRHGPAPRGAAGRGRRAGRTGSPRPARRRPRPARSRRPQDLDDLRPARRGGSAGGGRRLAARSAGPGGPVRASAASCVGGVVTVSAPKVGSNSGEPEGWGTHALTVREVARSRTYPGRGASRGRAGGEPRSDDDAGAHRDDDDLGTVAGAELAGDPGPGGSSR